MANKPAPVLKKSNLAINKEVRASFAYLLKMEARKAVSTPAGYAWRLDDKLTAYQFADALEIPYPKVLVRSSPISSLKITENTVVKPRVGVLSRGVFLIKSENEIFDLTANDVISGFDKLKARAREYLLTDIISVDDWLVEEMVFENSDSSEIAHDIKFYMFYGRVGVVLETLRVPEVKRCWYNSKSEIIKTGKYTKNEFVGPGFSAQDLELVTKISLEIPAPFVRIDFFRTKTGLVLNEFTPKPSGADQFWEGTDTRLGLQLIQAQGRLLDDSLKGKKFEKFFSSTDTDGTPNAD